MNGKEAPSTGPIPRRTDYRKHRRQDRWMVPMLSSAIDDALEHHARSLTAGSCLDVGCGEQPLRGKLEDLGLRYSSLDVEQNRSGSVHHIGAVDRSLPSSLANTQFDFIVCTEVLEHVANWPGAFANLAALLKPGGKLLVTCPHIWLPHEEPHDYFRPTDWALKFHASSAGLTTVSVQRLGDGFDVLGTIVAAVRVVAPSRRPWMWLLAGPLSLSRKLALAILSLSYSRHVFHLSTPLYLSTIGVFEKPAHPAG